MGLDELRALAEVIGVPATLTAFIIYERAKDRKSPAKPDYDRSLRDEIKDLRERVLKLEIITSKR